MALALVILNYVNDDLFQPIRITVCFAKSRCLVSFFHPYKPKCNSLFANQYYFLKDNATCKHVYLIRTIKVGAATKAYIFQIANRFIFYLQIQIQIVQRECMYSQIHMYYIIYICFIFMKQTTKW